MYMHINIHMYIMRNIVITSHLRNFLQAIKQSMPVYTYVCCAHVRKIKLRYLYCTYIRMYIQYSMFHSVSMFFHFYVEYY